MREYWAKSARHNYGAIDDNNSNKDGIDDGEDGFKELAQELNKEEGLGEPVQQTLANILETVWQIPNPRKKMKDKMKSFARPENYSSLVVKKCNKEIWQAHLTSRDRTKDLHFQKIQTAVLKGNIAITQVTSDLVKLKNNRVNCQRHQKTNHPCHQNLYWSNYISRSCKLVILSYWISSKMGLN